MIALYRNAFATARRLAGLALACLIATAIAAQAAPGEGRLSRDLREALEASQASAFRVIVQGNAATVGDLTQRYGGRGAKQLKTGAVIEVTRQALQAMGADASIGHLAGDTLVRSQMAVSAQAMGADQAWAGLLPGVSQATGRGIGVAIIDSGVSRHSALQTRILLVSDF